MSAQEKLAANVAAEERAAANKAERAAAGIPGQLAILRDQYAGLLDSVDSLRRRVAALEEGRKQTPPGTE